MTANDIKNKDFSKSLGNYKAGEVRAYLAELSDAFGALLAENDSLKGRVKELERTAEEFEKREGMLRESILAADAAAAEIKREAEAEAKRLQDEARAEADRNLLAAKAEAEQLLAETKTQAENLRAEEAAKLDAAKALRARLEGETSGYKEKVESIISMQLRIMNELL